MQRPEPWRRVTGERFNSLSQTLADLPATSQERQYARAKLLFPFLTLGFSMFWIVSGLVGFWQSQSASQIVSAQFGQPLALFSVLAGSVLDLLVGLGLLVRKTFRPACLAAIALSAFYLITGSIITPLLWVDPLGPFVKVIPVIALAAILYAIGEER